MQRLYKMLLTILLLLSLIITGCEKRDNSSPTSVNNKLTVAVSIVPQATFVKEVAGDLVNTVILIPPGNSPSNYAPSPKELVLLNNASLYFSIGVPTERVNILPKLKDINENIEIVDLVSEISMVYPERKISENRDPHIWLSPKRVSIMIDTIARELSYIDDKNKEIYLNNAAKYKKKLAQLDEEINKTVIKQQNKSFLVYHPSLGYFADDYGLNMIAVEKHGKETTIGNLREIIDFAKKNNIKVIFYQAEIDSTQTEVIAREIGGKSVLFSPLAADYIENIKNISQMLSSNYN